MTGKVRKGFRIYCTAIMGAALILGTSVTAFAAGDPITVVNNLSSFIFGLIRAIVLSCWASAWCRSACPSSPTTRPSEPTASDPCGRRIITFAKEIPRPDRRLSKPTEGRSRTFGDAPIL